AGRPGEAVPVIEEALALVDSTGERFLEADTLRVRGEMARAAEDPAAAVGWFQRAIDVARRQGARSLELRATLAWYRLDPSPSTEARQALAQVYGGFTEGFDSPDLCEARDAPTGS